MIDGLALQVLLSSRSMTIDRMRAVCDQVITGLELVPA